MFNKYATKDEKLCRSISAAMKEYGISISDIFKKHNSKIANIRILYKKNKKR